ncbi:hypothetical protein GZ77_05970 [Endozoicomonas montiporae]|uniref:Transmembrane protein n=2 Tax=Endozoicomonas montiporae TaxID=1027273 RepID=A0A081NC41_9GAMM|nr:hypothetical protein [Endozoicomonas montiporae]AMO56339.1 hypothetical protein EZMO1_2238 [Endozoicomonas montiporae CL-33]KEQ16014.1 hypothetical protein GZ77_05970 [Endozoicomonas montiporae]
MYPAVYNKAGIRAVDNNFAFLTCFYSVFEWFSEVFWRVRLIEAYISAFILPGWFLPVLVHKGLFAPLLPVINGEGWVFVSGFPCEGVVVKTLRVIEALCRFVFLFVLFCLLSSVTRVAKVAKAQDQVLHLETGTAKIRINIELVENEGDCSASSAFCLLRMIQSYPADSPPHDQDSDSIPMRGMEDCYGGSPVCAEGRGRLLEDRNDEEGAAACPNPRGSDTVSWLDVGVRQGVAETCQPSAAEACPGSGIPTGRENTMAWLTDRTPEDGEQVFRIPANRLEAFVRILVSLISGESGQICGRRPYCRCGNYVFDSEVNRGWTNGRIVVPSLLFLTAAGSGAAFGLGAPAVGAGCLTSGLVCSPFSTWLFGYTRFNRFQVGFAFGWNDVHVSWAEVTHLQKVVSMLQCTGGYDLETASFNRLTKRQALTFNVRVPDTVDADQLKAWLDTQNQQFGRPFEIWISSVKELKCTDDQTTRLQNVD